ncbi:MAG: 23S rRNA (guanosine(2251)-2'-O)-methyltransferase RlmB [Pseudonocardiales bacterium]|nr:MAG: 23S rRNA (guanosine(2251)-2'-O)-methyltransferase RlmB [Pseudonocardiales bacterium]
MPGNSKRGGAQRNPGTKKGAAIGSGGNRRRGLEGRGPTPSAQARTGHPAQRRAAAAARGSDGAQRRRRPPGQDLLVGRNPVAEALRAVIPATALYVVAGVEADERVTEAVRLAADRGLAILQVSRAEMDRMTGGVLHQGIGLQVPAYEYAHPDDVLARAQAASEPALVVALDGITDPRNLGAIVRSAAAFGSHGVVIPERRAASMTATAWRTSAGAAARLPVAHATNLARTLAAYRKAGLFTVGLDGAATTTLDQLDLTDGPLCLVAGAEGKGLSRLVGEGCDVTVRIPISVATESLNASVAVAIGLAEIARRRRAI